MAQTEPILDIIYLETHNTNLLAIADVTQYPTAFTISTPTIEITPPGYPTKSLAFVAKSVQVYNSSTLGITCDTVDCPQIPLPDGIWTIKYSVYPAYKYNVTKNFIIVKRLLEKFDDAWLKLDLFECDGEIESEDKKKLDIIEDYIKGAISAANKCYTKLAMELYNKASKQLTNFINNQCPTKKC